MERLGAKILLVLCLLTLPAYCAGDTFLFDFDSGTPAPHVYQPLPIDTTVNGLMASFSGRFSVQSNATTFFMLPLPFLDNYLSPSDVFSPSLDIKFSQNLTSIMFDFATVDMCAFETGTPVKLTAYVDSPAGAVIGSATAAAAEGCGFAMSTLIFNSPTPFNFVHIELVPGGASDFLVDNVQVTSSGAITPVPEASSLLLLGTGLLGAVSTLRRRLLG